MIRLRREQDVAVGPLANAIPRYACGRGGPFDREEVVDRHDVRHQVVPELRRDGVDAKDGRAVRVVDVDVLDEVVGRQPDGVAVEVRIRRVREHRPCAVGIRGRDLRPESNQALPVLELETAVQDTLRLDHVNRVAWRRRRFHLSQAGERPVLASITRVGSAGLHVPVGRLASGYGEQDQPQSDQQCSHGVLHWDRGKRR